MGLFTMRERATLANGTFEIASTPDRGTSVRVRIPLARPTTVVPPGRAPIEQSENPHAG